MGIKIGIGNKLSYGGVTPIPAVPFSPSDIANLARWIDPANGITITGSGISEIIEQSGNLKTYVQTTDSLRPQLISNGLNGNPVIRCDGIGMYMIANGDEDYTLLRSGCHIAFVSKINTFAVNSTLLGIKTTGNYSVLQFLAGGRLGMVMESDTNGNYWFAGTYPTVDFTGQACLHEIIANAGNISWYKDGVLEASGTPADDLTFNRIFKDTADLYNGDLAELIIYNNTVLTVSERADLVSYFNTKYSL